MMQCRGSAQRIGSSLLGLALMVGGAAALVGCKAKEKPEPTVEVPASSDPEGKDIVEGAIVAAYEPDGGVRLYKVTEVKWFPKPMGDEMVMHAFREKGNDFVHAAKLYGQRNLTVVVPNVRVPKNSFIRRNYRVLGVEPVSQAERALDRNDPLPPLGGPATPPAATSG